MWLVMQREEWGRREKRVEWRMKEGRQEDMRDGRREERIDQRQEEGGLQWVRHPYDYL